MEELWKEIQKFKAWADSRYPGLTSYEIPGEWEMNYNGWNRITTLFEKVIKCSKPADYSKAELSELVYIIARDNECEDLAGMLSDYPDWFMTICELSLYGKEPDAKWQMAVRLKYAEDKKQAGLFLEKFVRDDNEYVNRRALLELPALLPDKVEAYSKLFWNQEDCGDMQEYQRMAVLTVLKEINSPMLPEYLERAATDGRKYLVRHADKIRSEIERCRNG